MYNILKRPMFKMGGQADQGSGIMSHVEPRSNYMFGNIAQPLTPFQASYANLPAYAYGGRIGYAQAGPVMPGTLPTAKSPYPIYGREQALESLYGKDAIENAYKKEVDKYKQNILGIQNQMGTLSQDPESGVFLPGAEENIAREEQGLAKLLTPEGKKAFETKKMEEFNRIRKEQGLETLVPKEEPKVEGGEDTKTIKPTKKETVDTDPRTKIKEEADMLKGLLRDEGLTTAENALIIARALGTPGGINAKIAAAGELAMPIIKERAKIDKEAVLKAYETSKEIKKAEIAAGKKDAAAQLSEDVVNTKIRIAEGTPGGTIVGEDGVVRYKDGNEFKTRDQLALEVYNIRTGLVPATSRAKGIEAIQTLKDQITKLEAEKKPNVDLINRKKMEIERINNLLKGQYKTGGRVNKAFGGMSMDETTTEDTTGDKTETIVDTNVDGFPMKPVQKLSFEEIRSRLPREITDDIVRLIANSAEALQDFAYIKTQQDVNQFNVKYGVNLVLPQNV